ncbi:hypothetical protein D3C78_890460 [compost metagenome]
MVTHAWRPRPAASGRCSTPTRVSITRPSPSFPSACWHWHRTRWTGCFWSTAAPRPTTWRFAWPGPTAAVATCSACWRRITAGRWPPTRSRPRSPTTRKPSTAGRTGYTRLPRRTPIGVSSVASTARRITCAASSTIWRKLPSRNANWRASSVSRCMATPAGFHCHRAT